MFTTLNTHQLRSVEEQEEHSSWPPLLLSTQIMATERGEETFSAREIPWILLRPPYIGAHCASIPAYSFCIDLDYKQTTTARKYFSWEKTGHKQKVLQ